MSRQLHKVVAFGTRYVFVIAIVAVAVGLRIWPLQGLGPKIPFLTFYPAVMLAALLGGLSTGMLATVLAFLAVEFLWPLLVPHPFIGDHVDPPAMIVFILSGGIVSGVAEAMHRARARETIARKLAESSIGALEESKAGIQRLVEERTGELKESREQLSQLTHRLHRVREEEGQRIARDLHDEAGQVLTGIKMDLAMMRQQGVNAESGARGDSSIREISLKIDGVVDFIRNISRELHPPVLAQMGVAAAIRGLVDELTKKTALKFITELTDIERGAEDLISITLYRITQEALTNIIRHAGATVVHITLSDAERQITLTIEDNGRGMDVSQMNVKSLGIIGMRERTNSVGGKFSIESHPGQGTKVTVIIPNRKHQVQTHADTFSR